MARKIDDDGGPVGDPKEPKYPKNTPSPSYQMATKQGPPIPIVYGTDLLAPQVIWTGNTYPDSPIYSFNKTTGASYNGGARAATKEVLLALCEAPISGVNKWWLDSNNVAITDVTKLLQIDHAEYELVTGTTPAVPNSSWSVRWAAFNIASNGYNGGVTYAGVAQLRANRLAMPDGSLPNLKCEVKGSLCTTTAGFTADCNPADVIANLIARVPSIGYTTVITDTGPDGLAASSYRNYCQAMGLFVSQAIIDQEKAVDLIDSLLFETNSTMVQTEGKVKIYPLGDTAVTKNGATYTPPATAYLLDESEIIKVKGRDPVELERSRDETVVNAIPVSFMDRSQNYEESIVEFIDQTHAAAIGTVKRGEMVQSKWFKFRGTLFCPAYVLSKILVAKSINCRNTVRFSVGPRWALLEPLDLVAITDTNLGLNQAQYRIKTIAKQADGSYKIEALEWPAGTTQVIDVTPVAPDNVGVTVPDYANVTATAAYEANNSAMAQLSDIASDQVLTANEKPAAKINYDALVLQGTSTKAKAAALSPAESTTVYDTPKAALDTYLATLGTHNLLGNSDFYYSTATAGIPDGFFMHSGGSYTNSIVASGGSESWGDGGPFWRQTWYSTATGYSDWQFYTSGGVTNGTFNSSGGYAVSTQHTLSFYARASGTPVGRTITPNLGFHTLNSSTNPALTTDWQRYIFTFTTHASAFSTIWFGETGSHVSGDTVDFDDVQLEVGGTATSWEPTNLPWWDTNLPSIGIDPTTWNNTWTAVYEGLTKLLNNVTARAQTDASTALTTLTAIGADSVLSKGEKPEVITRYTAVLNDRVTLVNKANALGVTHSAYDTAYTNLTNYINGLSPAYNLTTYDTTIVAVAWQSYWQTYYNEETILNQAITAKAQTDATSALNLITAIGSDGVLSKGEKPQVIIDWAEITNSITEVNNQANIAGVSHNALDTAYYNLGGYLGGLSPAWNNTAADTNITASTWQAYWSDYYAQLNKVLANTATAMQNGKSASGTDNLVDNSSFTACATGSGSPDGFGVYNNDAGAVPTIHTWVTSGGVDNGAYVRTTWTGTNASTKGILSNNSTQVGFIKGGVTGGWQPYKTYIVSFYARNYSGCTGQTIGLAWNTAPSTTVVLQPALSSSWQRYAFRCVWGASVENIGAFYIYLAAAVANGGWEIDHLQIEEGNVMTGYAARVGNRSTTDISNRAGTAIACDPTTQLVWYRGNDTGAPVVGEGTGFRTSPRVSAKLRRFYTSTPKFVQVQLTIQPQANTDNLDSLRYIRVKWMGTNQLPNTASTVAAVAEYSGGTGIYYYPVTDRRYETPGTVTSATNAFIIDLPPYFSEVWSTTTSQTGYCPAMMVTLYNASGNSQEICFYLLSRAEGTTFTLGGSDWNAGTSNISGSSGGSSGGYVPPDGTCVAPWELVWTSTGPVAAEDVRIGDLVYTRHEVTGEWGNYEVVGHKVSTNRRGTATFSDGSKITCTPNHRLQLANGSFLEVGWMEPGQLLVTSGGRLGFVGYELEDEGDVIKITVKDAHTYVVNGLVNHNMKIQ